MTSQVRIASLLACATFVGAALIAQNSPQNIPPHNITGLPAARGVYYRASNRWVALSPNVLMPFWEGRSLALDILNVGSNHAIIEIPGSHAGVQIGNNNRPTFYLHGVDASDVYLVRAFSRPDYREVEMNVSRHFREWAHFRDRDLTAFEIEVVNRDTVAIRPSVNLQPGEYAVASLFEPGGRWLRLGFDFGIAGH